MTRVYLVRHGTHDLVDRVLAGRMTGVHLAPEGRDQAARLAAFFAERDVTTVLSSPLERCRETAAPVAERLALPVAIDEGLIELNCGAWTGLTFEALRRDPRWAAWNDGRAAAAIPGGDTMAAARDRIMGMLKDLGTSEREPAVLVSHADIIKAAVLTLLGASLDAHDRITVDPASVTTLDLWPGGGKVVRLNEAVP